MMMMMMMMMMIDGDFQPHMVGLFVIAMFPLTGYGAHVLNATTPAVNMFFFLEM